MAARLVQAGMLVGGSVGAAITIRGCVKATQPAERPTHKQANIECLVILLVMRLLIYSIPIIWEQIDLPT